MTKQDAWQKKAIIYQIYPKSFQDSNGDGIGDLNGVRQRIPYLKQLGITAVWLNPIYQSPGIDNGYDVSDYYKIDPVMGTMADFEALVTDLQQAGIKLIMDFVLNHTSDQHPWFKAAVSDPASPYRDYYIFAGKNGVRPNNWGSFFGGSCWAADPAGTGQSYFHLFAKEMFKAAEFWLKKGVDGLRLDAFIHIAKADLRQSYPSEDDKPIIAEDFFANRPEVQEWLAPFCARLREEFPDLLLLGEAASASINLAVDYTDPKRNLMDSVITFRYFTEKEDSVNPDFSGQYQPKEFDWLAFKQNQTVWQQTLSAAPTLYWSNHDMARLATRVAKTPVQQQSLAMAMYLERGIPVIYYGEELGLHNLEFDNADQFADETVADFVKEAGEAGVDEKTSLEMASQTHKLPARGPMPWDDSQYGGFSTAEPWLTGRSRDKVSVASEDADPASMLNFYRQLLKLKQTPLFTKGSYYLLDTKADLLVYQRDLGDDRALVVVSLSVKKEHLTLPEELTPVLTAGSINLQGKELTLMPFAGVVLQKKK
ncbi:alpha-glucosidase [Lactobacillus delbrueckii subsp. lactis]|uniref:alpha-glucosidase n=1 Tax=Lactobacillus delbrueckii TaxID=1584 RepID=UPI001E5DC9CF|nr:alpha-glucosidase [Lactobacillus delbrueckii]MCD9218555.1 alpha-glucosidase [Lactobacillus delbrueckii subsp. lactis]